MCPRKLSVQLKILKTFMKKLIFVKTGLKVCMHIYNTAFYRVFIKSRVFRKLNNGFHNCARLLPLLVHFVFVLVL